MLAGNAHTKDPRPDTELQRRIEHQCLAVDAGGHGAVGVDLERRCRPFAPRALQHPAALAAPRGRADDGDAEQGVVDPRSRARTDRSTQPVAIVRDEYRPPGMVRLPARAGPAQVVVAAVRAEHVRHGVEQGAQLRVAVALALDGFGVEPERDVVHEHSPVDLGEVHDALAAVDERVQRTDHVVTIDSEVEREVVACARGHAGVGQAGARRRSPRRWLGSRRRRPSRARRRRGRPPRERAPRDPTGGRARSARSRARAASSASAKRSALPPPDFGLKKSTGWRGADPAGRGTWTARVARAAASVTSSPTTTSRSRKGDPSATSSAIAPANARPATVSPATRATPRRSTAYQADAPDTTTQPSRPNPRGNSLTELAIASTTVAVPTSSATVAASRRVIGSGVLEHGCRTCGQDPRAAALDRGCRAPGPRRLRRHSRHPDSLARRRQ